MSDTTKRPPNAGIGKAPGTPNKTTRLLKDAILLAAEQVGEDGEGKDGLLGYLKTSAQKERKAFLGLLGKVLPLRLTGPTGSGPVLTGNAADLTDDQLAAIAAGADAYEQTPEDEPTPDA